MVNIIKKINAIVIATLLTLTTAMAFWTVESNAASCYISCPSSVTQGSTFTATVVYTGEEFGAVVGNWSYGGNFQYVSGETSFTQMSGSPVSQLTSSITLKAVGTGSGYLSVSTSSISAYDPDKSVGVNSASASVSVSAPSSNNGSSSNKSSKAKKKTDDPQAEKEAAKTEEDKHEKPSSIEVEVAGTKYTIVENFKEVPNGFKKAEFTYGEYKWKVQGVKSKDGKYKLLKVKDATTGDKTWFFYDETSSTLSPTTPIAGSELMEMYGNEGVEESKTPLIVITVLGLAIIVLAGFLFGKNQKLKELRGPKEPKKVVDNKYESKH